MNSDLKLWMCLTQLCSKAGLSQLQGKRICAIQIIKLNRTGSHLPCHVVQLNLWDGTATGHGHINFVLLNGIRSQLDLQSLYRFNNCVHCPVMSIHSAAWSVHIILTVNQCISLNLGFHPWMSSTEMQNKYAEDSVVGSCPISPTHPQNNANDFSDLTGRMTLFPFPVQPLTRLYSCTGCNQGDVKNLTMAN